MQITMRAQSSSLNLLYSMSQIMLLFFSKSCDEIY